MATENFIGQTLYVSAALPATNTAAGFEALTWTKAGGIQQLPQLGTSNAIIDVEDLQTGFTSGVKGAGSGNDSQMAFRDTGTPDDGQAIIKTAANGANGAMSIKIVEGSGTAQAPVSGDPVEYAQGFAHSYLFNQGNVSNHKGFTANFKQNALSVSATEPA